MAVDVNLVGIDADVERRRVRCVACLETNRQHRDREPRVERRNERLRRRCDEQPVGRLAELRGEVRDVFRRRIERRACGGDLWFQCFRTGGVALPKQRGLLRQQRRERCLGGVLASRRGSKCGARVGNNLDWSRRRLWRGHGRFTNSCALNATRIGRCIVIAARCAAFATNVAPLC